MFEKSPLRAFSKGLEKRGADPHLEWGTTAPPPPGSVGGAVGGLHVTTKSATEIAAVYGCVGLLADSVASLPLRVLDKPATVNTAKELDIPELLQKPYEPISLTDWIVGFIWALALRGNYFGQIIERENGYPSQIMPINPDIVSPEIDPDGSLHWRYAGKRIKDEDVFHVRYQSMPGTALGLNPIQCMRYSFGIAHVQDTATEKTFANSSDPRGVIQAKRELTEQSARQMKAMWNSAHQGVNQSGIVGILDNESAYVPINISPADLQLLESRKFSAEEISGMVFRIPPHMLGLNERSTSFGRGIEQQERTFVTNTLQGYLTRAEEALSACIPDGQYVNFDTRWRVQGDSLQKSEVAYKMILAGAWTANDARATFLQPPLPDGEGDVIHSPTNSELLEQQLEELAKSEKEKPGEEQQQPFPALPSGNGNGAPPLPAKGKAKTPRLAELIGELRATRAQPPAPQPLELHVHNETNHRIEPSRFSVGDVNVETPEVRNEVIVPERSVTVNSPEIRSETPVVNVAPPNVSVAAPNVNVEPADVNVIVKPNLQATLKAADKRVERNSQGQITKVREEK